MWCLTANRLLIVVTTLTRDIRCEHFVKDESVSLVVFAPWYNLYMYIMKFKGSTKKTCATPDTNSHYEPILRCGQKLCDVETYYSSI